MVSKIKRMQDVPTELREKLKAYFTDVGGDTFCIHGLPPELTGGALARYSRAKTGMQLTIINEFLDENGDPAQEKGSALMNRVLNAYGDESVGELEGAHIGLENISILLTKIIEDRRIGGSPIEQSTRYVMYDQKDDAGNWRYLRPKEIMESAHAAAYEDVMDQAFEVYATLIPKLKELFTKQFPRASFTIEVTRNGKKTVCTEDQLETPEEKRAFRNAYNFTIRCAALDVGRCMLPSSTLTHMGVFGNGRYCTALITHLKSNVLAECKERAEQLQNELNKVIPTFVKRTRVIIGQQVIDRNMRAVVEELFTDVVPEDNYVELVDRAEHLDEIVSAALYPYCSVSLKQIMLKVKQLSQQKKVEILQVYRGTRTTRRDRSGRGLESGYPITFDLVGGFAEYRDLQRHRMLTQQRQLLSIDLGFIIPPEVIDIGMEKEVEQVVSAVESLHNKLRDDGLLEVSQYCTLFNHRIRWMMGMNIREFQHLAELRTSIHGHHSYRHMTMEMARALHARDPWTEEFTEFINFEDPDNRIARANEQSRIAGKNIATGVDASVDLE